MSSQMQWLQSYHDLFCVVSLIYFVYSYLEFLNVSSYVASTDSLGFMQDVRKTIVLSLPPSNKTLAAIIDCTLDVSESVRRAVYFVVASKFPLQSLR